MMRDRAAADRSIHTSMSNGVLTLSADVVTLVYTSRVNKKLTWFKILRIISRDIRVPFQFLAF